ncbi:efflux RND transporter permease subunit [Nibricoccus sp. IMCC34717]|uniref:efflux RND transporter permease subunit n=1 Tax=Nibricoccus sp. IMCC34717 TaxID=3034021 RepID=UPI00384B1767
MILSSLCLRRPVMTALLTGALCVFGTMAYRLLPVSDLPNVDFPTIQVNASLPGATPETMASAVATPLEQQFSTIAGIDSMSSSSSLGSTQITLQFRLDRAIDAAAQDVQAAIAAVQRRLPADMPAPPSYRKVNPADQPILFMTVRSGTLPLSLVNEYAETTIGQRISMVDGVSQVQVWGAQKYALRVRLDPRLLASRGITLDEVKTAVAAHNVNLPTGLIDGARQALTVVADGQLVAVDDYRAIVVTYRGGSPVRLGELAQVIESVQDIRSANWMYKDGESKRSLILAVQRQPGANTVAVADRVKALLPALQKQLPESVTLEIFRDASEVVRASVHDVQFTLILAVGLVVLVIFAFLRSAVATFIPSTAIPMALLGTFVVMYFCGYTLDNLSLLALTLSVGFVVDDAIVMLENIVRHVENGQPVAIAAERGSSEIGFTILSMTLSLVAVFLPLMFMGGILGRLLHEFAVTISAAILVSGLVSLTLTPVLCRAFLKPHKAGHDADALRGPLGWFERSFRASQAFYQRTLTICVRYRRATLSSALVLAVLTGVVAWVLPKGFIPTDDIGIIVVQLEASQDTSFEAMSHYARNVSEATSRHPGVAAVQAILGGATNSGRCVIRLKDRSERSPANDIVNELRTTLATIPGVRSYPQIPPPVRLTGQLSRALYQISLSSSDLKTLYEAAPKAEAALRALPQLVDLNSDLMITSPQLRVQINRDRAATLGVTPQQIEDTLYSAYGSRQVSTIYTPTNQYWVILEVDRVSQQDPQSLSLIRIRSKSGNLIPLESVATLTREVGPLNVNHFGQTPAVTLSFNLAPGAALGDATDAIERALAGTLPDGVSHLFIGTAQAFAESTKGLGLLLATAVLVIYIVLGILYEDFIHPITILSGLPAAGFGALATLWVFGEELNIMGYVGVILLIGIVKKNAIMMIDFAISAQRDAGGLRKSADVIVEAGLVRFRPIMMTTFAALAGAIPIALGIGAGAESRRSLGLAVIGGLVVSQVITLYLTPALYVTLEEWRARRKEPAPIK